MPDLAAPRLLGKLEKKPDGRNLLFAAYAPTRPGLAKPKPKVVRTPAVASWPMYLNDSLPDCTVAAVAHAEQLTTAVHQQPWLPTDADVLAMFDATGPRGEGRACLDVLKLWQGTGFGAAPRKVRAFVEVDPSNADHVKLAIELFGFVYAGISLPVSAQGQSVWSVRRGPGTDAGSWGGHCVPLFDFTARGGPSCVTWGSKLRMTWQFWRTYADEAYTVITDDWLDANGKSPGGFDVDALLADLAAVKRG